MKKLATIFVLILAGLMSKAATIYVNKSATGANNGTNWANAYTDLQSALVAAVAADQIWIAVGTYYPSIAIDFDGAGGATVREATFKIPSNVKVYGGFNGTETLVTQANPQNNIVVLSGDIGVPAVATDNCYHVVYTLNAGSSTELNGVTITGGRADLFGGNNRNASAGGWLNFSSGADTASPAITKVIFDSNYAAAFGGGLGNWVQSGGICHSIITNCIFSYNHGDWQAGGIWTSAYSGGKGNLTIYNSLFYNNSTTGAGAAIYNDGRFGGAQSNTTIYNCSFYGNTAAAGQGAIRNENDGAGASNGKVTNSILWNNTGGSWSNHSTASMIANYTLINEATVSTGTTAGAGMIYNTNPSFTNATASDFTLQANSPAINAGNNAANLTSIDLAGNPRIANTTIDCGAYEFDPCKTPVLGTDTRTACNSYKWIDGNTYTASNNSAIFNIVGGAANGCDSLVTLNLTINKSSTGTDTRTACNSYKWIDGNIYTSSNNSATFNIVGGAANGCDSLVTLNLTFKSVSDITVSKSGLTLSANNTAATYQWLDCNKNNAVIANETGKAFTAKANGNYAVELTENGCVDTSVCVAITTVGIVENNFGDGFVVYPNPTSGNLSIDLGAVYENAEIVITDISGKMVASKKLTQSQFIHLSLEEPAGVYMASIEAGNKRALIRLVKK